MKKKFALKKYFEKKIPDPPKTTFTPSQPSLLLFLRLDINICYDNMVTNIVNEEKSSVKVDVNVVNVMGFL